MDRTVLDDPAVAGYCNERFVALRLNVCEKGSADLLRRYRLRKEAPVFLVLGADGEELDRFHGAVPKDEFLAFLKDAVAGNHFAALERRAAGGEKGYEFLVAYGMRLYHRRAPEALDVLRKAVAFDPDVKKPATVDAKYRLAKLASGDAMVEQLAAFAAAHPESPHAVEAHQSLSLMYGPRNPDRAIASFEFLRERGGLDPPWRKHDYARLLAWSGRELDLALSLVTDALRVAPDEARWLDTKAECLSRLGRYDEAIDVEDRAVAKAKSIEDRAEFRRALYEMKKRRAEASR